MKTKSSTVTATAKLATTVAAAGALLLLAFSPSSSIGVVKADDFCKAYDPTYFDSYGYDAGDGGLGDASFDSAMQNIELMAQLEHMKNIADLLSVVPFAGDFFAVSSAALGLYQEGMSIDVALALKDYVDAVDVNNKISDIQTDWGISAGIVSSALDGSSVDDFDLGADECIKFFGPSYGGDSWTGSLSYDENDYQVFNATERLVYAPAMCNACISLHAWRYWKNGLSYEALAEDVGKTAANATKVSMEGALDDLKYTLGRCFLDVAPMAMDATWDGFADNFIGDMQTKGVGFTTRYYAKLKYDDGMRFFEYDEGYFDYTSFEENPIPGYYDNCARDMKKNVADFFMQYYRDNVLNFQRGWGLMAAAVSPNGLVLKDSPTLSTDKEYVIMSEAYGAFVSVGGSYDDQNYKTGSEGATESSTGAFVRNDPSLKVTIRPIDPDSSLSDIVAIQDVTTGRYLGLSGDGAYWFDDPYDTPDVFGWLQLIHVDEENDPTAFYIHNPTLKTGTYMTTGTSFVPIYSRAAVDTQATNTPDDFAVFRFFQAPDNTLEIHDYTSMKECQTSDECSEEQICDPNLFYCRTSPALDIGEQCSSDDECASGVCQTMTNTVDRCADNSSEGSLLTVCDATTSCNSDLFCSKVNTDVWGLCKYQYGDRCLSDEQCHSGICNSLSVGYSKCDEVESGEFTAFCTADADCSSSYVCNTDGKCDYDGDWVYVLSTTSSYFNFHESNAAKCGGHLASVSDADDDGIIEDLLLRSYLRDGVRTAWIGLEAFQGSWSWTDGSDSTYRNWQENYPRTSSKANTWTVAYLYGGTSVVWQSRTGNYNYGVYRLPSNYASLEACDITITDSFEF